MKQPQNMHQSKNSDDGANTQNEDEEQITDPDRLNNKRPSIKTDEKGKINIQQKNRPQSKYRNNTKSLA